MAYTPNSTWVDGSGGGTPITAARLNNIEAGLPYELAYAEFTSNVSITATTEATANTIKAAPAVTFDGSTAVYIECYSPSWQTVATNGIFVVLYQDGTSIGRIGDFYAGAGLVNVAGVVERRMTPAAGSRTYSIRAYTNTGTATVVGGAGGVGNMVPGYIRIVRAV